MVALKGVQVEPRRPAQHNVQQLVCNSMAHRGCCGLTILEALTPRTRGRQRDNPSRTFWRVLRNAGAVKAPAYLCQSFVAACLAVAEEAVSRGNVVLFCGGGNYATTRGLPVGAKRIRTWGFSGMRWWMSGNFSVTGLT